MNDRALETDPVIDGFVPYDADLDRSARVFGRLAEVCKPSQHRENIKTALYCIRAEQMRRFVQQELEAGEREPVEME